VAGLPLVTGAAGFAGSHLVDHLLEFHPRVAAWANPSSRPAPLRRDVPSDPRVEWRAVDVLDTAAVAEALATLQPSAIYHLAGVPHVGESWAQPVRALRVNALGTHHLFEGLREAAVACPVLVTGSAMVYRQSDGAISEAHPLGPASPYAVSKLAQEMVAARAAGARVFLTRPFNHAGPRQDSSFVTSSFARQIAEIERGLREPVLHVGNLASRRDITDVRDVARAYRLLLEHGRPGRPYNVCSGTAYLISDLLDALLGMSDARIRVEPDPARVRPSDNPIVLGDHARLTADAGWTPRIPIAQTLRDLLEYWRAETAPTPAA
jgi:GDP-4-dehydro-6-deoxy-D-mannose reductase